ncbi:MAG: 50S ribosomal protein L11 methyltransferase, partial [Phocaeicola sp.]|nr:50S ribosomal protein L11 methyltransferase [Phocaeicola sp.]
YKVREAEDKDWNEQWEQEGFEPIVVADKLVIHDGRHLPSAISLQPSVSKSMLIWLSARERTKRLA